MTVFVTSLHERALVEITPTAKSLLSVGTHVMYLAGCTISINVKIFGMLLVLTVPRTTHCIALIHCRLYIEIVMICGISH